MRNYRSATLVLAAAVALAGAPPTLHAQEADTPPAEDNTIVVSEQIARPGVADVHSQALEIAVSGNVFSTPLARFEIPLCPGIGGLTDETAGLMIDRIRENARFVGLEVADVLLAHGCRMTVLEMAPTLAPQMARESADWAGIIAAQKISLE